MQTMNTSCSRIKPVQRGRASLIVTRTRRTLTAPTAIFYGFRTSTRGIKARHTSCSVEAKRDEVDHSAVAVAARVSEDPSLYYEPFLRSFVLGLSAGAAFEAIHVALKFASLVQEVGYGSVTQAFASSMERFAPMFLNDHIVAMGCWMVFYVIEAVAIVQVLDKHAQNPAAAGHAMRKMKTLPRLMLPKLSAFRTMFKLLELGATHSWQSSARTSTITSRSPSTVANSILIAPPRKKQALEPKQIPPIHDDDQEPEGPPEQQGSLQKKRAQLGLRPGQLELSTAEFFRRKSELASRRCYLQNFWYAAGISEKVQDKPVGLEILGEKLVLFRDEAGKIQCLQDVCPHRGAPLHLGWTSHVGGHDCIVCPYHGWAFDAEGRLQDVPAAENRSEWPRKPLIESYPVEEKGGFIWLFYGSKQMPVDERPPIPFVPELEDKSWRPVYGEIEFECNHWSVFENAIDMAHIHYLHSDSFGNDDMPQIKDMTCTSGAYGISATFKLHNKPVNAMWEFSKVPEVKVSAQALLPSTSVIGFSLGQGLSFITFVNTVPISATRTINRFALIRRLDVDKIGSYVFNLPTWDALARDAMKKILTQDKAMVEKLVPEMLGREISVKADLPQIAFRKLRKEYIDMGYGVEPDTKACFDALNKDM